MKYKGIIFDFNGTLFCDSHLHKLAWREYSKRLTGVEFTDEEMVKHMFGRTNEQIIEYAIKRKPSPEMVEEIGQEKEEYYRQMCLNSPETLHLTKGAVEFLDFLKQNDIPRTIATMSDKTNVDFYFKTFNLSNWFEYDKVVYADGIIPSKPAPDIYEIAAKNLNLNPEDCIVVEDAISGINSARDAKIGKIIAICTEEPRQMYEAIPCVTNIINDFTEFDNNLFDLKVHK